MARRTARSSPCSGFRTGIGSPDSARKRPDGLDAACKPRRWRRLQERPPVPGRRVDRFHPVRGVRGAARAGRPSPGLRRTTSPRTPGRTGPRRRRGHTTPCSRRAGSGSSARTMRPLCSRAGAACTARWPGQARSVRHRRGCRTSHSMPKWPNIAVMARKDRSCVRAVVWRGGGADVRCPRAPAGPPRRSSAGWSAVPGHRCSPRPRSGRCAPGCRGPRGPRRRSSFRSRRRGGPCGARRRAGRRPGSARGRRSGRRGRLRQVPVLVPLEVADVVFAQQGVERGRRCTARPPG